MGDATNFIQPCNGIGQPRMCEARLIRGIQLSSSSLPTGIASCCPPSESCKLGQEYKHQTIRNRPMLRKLRTEIIEPVGGQAALRHMLMLLVPEGELRSQLLL